MKSNLRFVCCPRCRHGLKFAGKDSLSCTFCKARYPVRQGILVLAPGVPRDMELSHDKWEYEYGHQLESGDFESKFAEYESHFFPDTLRQIEAKKRIGRRTAYLEIGCGEFFFGQCVASRCGTVIGVDFSFNALRIAKRMLDKRGTRNYLLIQADIRGMPIRSRSIDLIYGGGVIEHFKDTQACVNELYRVLRPGGVSFNTVPYLNIGSAYRQVWGNIPNLPVVRETAEAVHVSLLGGRHMRFGYELSFPESELRKIHLAAGFREVEIGRFDVELRMEFVPKFLRSRVEYLAKNSRHFWPMVKVIAVK
jgi:ubiquinone/menaquinone biosynthesis C-methylase UbiE/uncharacterized protein YbaR (Trm112 family)